MKTKDLIKIDGVKCLTQNLDLSSEVNELYISDLLSWVMGHAKDDNTVLLTVLNSINVIAVAVLLDFSAVVFCEGVIPTQDVINKAIEEGIPLFTTDTSSSKLAKAIWEYKSKNE